MDYVSAVFILGILFWVLCALLIVCCFVWCYLRLTYLKWDREDRQNETIVHTVVDTVHDELDKLQ